LALSGDSVSAGRFSAEARNDGAAHPCTRTAFLFCLADAVPDDHPIREIAAVLDLKWVYAELATTAR
jgi:hypothetical protein